ncbi:hypothetical protein DESAMIL20_570 [Desulfurella amilsii]|uniref:Uncharacterized protein n=1 Tax=Desulfurella amilsii TaxID=1562698 RepID=A0A1X4XYS1_9BACT|nr:hypothetical protein [Desulfurella amilsii]OSS42687.1 hypothetical protein DESAMIL20_570 [Desulfurella amilsii]
MKTYKRYHPLVWILVIIPILILSFGIPYYNRNDVVFGFNFMSFFLVIMDIVTIILTFIAYIIEQKTSQRRKQ